METSVKFIPIANWKSFCTLRQQIKEANWIQVDRDDEDLSLLSWMAVEDNNYNNSV